MTIEFPAEMPRIELIESLEGLAAQYYLYAAEKLTSSAGAALHATIVDNTIDPAERVRAGGELSIKSAELLYELLDYAGVREDDLLSRVSRIERLLRKSHAAIYPAEIEAETTIARIGVLTRELAEGAVDELLAKLPDTTAHALAEDRRKELCRMRSALIGTAHALAADDGRKTDPIRIACRLLDASRAALTALVDPTPEPEPEQPEDIICE